MYAALNLTNNKMSKGQVDKDFKSLQGLSLQDSVSDSICLNVMASNVNQNALNSIDTGDGIFTLDHISFFIEDQKGTILGSEYLIEEINGFEYFTRSRESLFFLLCLNELSRRKDKNINEISYSEVWKFITSWSMNKSFLGTNLKEIFTTVYDCSTFYEQEDNFIFRLNNSVNAHKYKWNKIWGIRRWKENVLFRYKFLCSALGGVFGQEIEKNVKNNVRTYGYEFKREKLVRFFLKEHQVYRLMLSSVAGIKECDEDSVDFGSLISLTNEEIEQLSIDFGGDKNWFTILKMLNVPESRASKCKDSTFFAREIFEMAYEGRFGEEVIEEVVEGLLSGIYNGYLPDISVKNIISNIVNGRKFSNLFESVVIKSLSGEFGEEIYSMVLQSFGYDINDLQGEFLEKLLNGEYADLLPLVVRNKFILDALDGLFDVDENKLFSQCLDLKFGQFIGKICVYRILSGDYAPEFKLLLDSEVLPSELRNYALNYNQDTECPIDLAPEIDFQDLLGLDMRSVRMEIVSKEQEYLSILDLPDRTSIEQLKVFADCVLIALAYFLEKHKDEVSYLDVFNLNQTQILSLLDTTVYRQNSLYYYAKYYFCKQNEYTIHVLRNKFFKLLFNLLHRLELVSRDDLALIAKKWGSKIGANGLEDIEGLDRKSFMAEALLDHVAKIKNLNVAVLSFRNLLDLSEDQISNLCIVYRGVLKKNKYIAQQLGYVTSEQPEELKFNTQIGYRNVIRELARDGVFGEEMRVQALEFENERRSVRTNDVIDFEDGLSVGTFSISGNPSNSAGISVVSSSESSKLVDDADRLNLQVTSKKGFAFEQLAGLYLSYLFNSEIVIPQFALDYDHVHNRHLHRVDFLVGETFYECKWGNAASNIETTISTHQRAIRENFTGYDYKVLTCVQYDGKSEDVCFTLESQLETIDDETAKLFNDALVHLQLWSELSGAYTVEVLKLFEQVCNAASYFIFENRLRGPNRNNFIQEVLTGLVNVLDLQDAEIIEAFNDLISKYNLRETFKLNTGFFLSEKSQSEIEDCNQNSEVLTVVQVSEEVSSKLGDWFKPVRSLFDNVTSFDESEVSKLIELSEKVESSEDTLEQVDYIRELIVLLKSKLS